MIEHTNGSTTLTGGHIQWYGLVALLKGLEFEAKTGMKVSRVSALQVAKHKLGILPRKRLSYPDAIAKVTELVNAAKLAADAEGPRPAAMTATQTLVEPRP